MNGSPVLDKVSHDLDAGRLWKARDRLSGAIGSRPHDAELLDVLGEVYFRMGDLPAAGKAWLLSGRAGRQTDQALAAYAERTPHAIDRLRQLGARPPLERYPDAAQRHIEALRAQARREGHEWAPPGTPGEPTWSREVTSEGNPWYIGLLIAVLVIVTVVPWLVGVSVAIWLLVRTIR
jgi:hypothetical protein